VAVFVQVLQCSIEEAQFYLESSEYEMEAAVVLWLDTNNSYATSRSTYTTTQRRWEAKNVAIDGLPDGWLARVSRRDGTVYFIHVDSGYTQREVSAITF
jgi:UBA-like domain